MTPNSFLRESAQIPKRPLASLPRPSKACAAGMPRGGHRPHMAAMAATGSGQEGWAGLTFTLPAFPFVARLAEAFVGLGCVLADGIDVAVIRAL